MTTLQELPTKAILTCVEYHDILGLTLPINAHHFESVTVVTTPGDKKTQEVVDKIPNATCHLTDAFYAHGREFFNKGASIEEGFDVVGRDGWILVLDADIVLPSKIELPNLNEQKIYGTQRRILEDAHLFVDGLFREEEGWEKLPLKYEGSCNFGFFQLFNSNAKPLKSHPWYPVEWQTAAFSDVVFDKKWDVQNRHRLLDFQVLHLGEIEKNWLGRTTPFLNGDLPKKHKKDEHPTIQSVLGYKFRTKNFRVTEWLTFPK